MNGFCFVGVIIVLASARLKHRNIGMGMYVPARGYCIDVLWVVK